MLADDMRKLLEQTAELERRIHAKMQLSQQSQAFKPRRAANERDSTQRTQTSRARKTGARLQAILGRAGAKDEDRKIRNLQALRQRHQRH